MAQVEKSWSREIKERGSMRNHKKSIRASKSVACAHGCIIKRILQREPFPPSKAHHCAVGELETSFLPPSDDMLEVTWRRRSETQKAIAKEKPSRRGGKKNLQSHVANNRTFSIQLMMPLLRLCHSTRARY